MSSDALRRFESSMNIGFGEWHDGIGYDLSALDELTPSEKGSAEGMLIPRAGKDWRDLEALDRLNTPSSIAAILGVRLRGNPEMRLRAHEYGPPPLESEWENPIVESLETAEIFSGLLEALDCAISHPSEAVIAKLWEKVRNPESGVAYHCAASLCCIKGVVDSMYDDSRRSLFLRLVGPASEDRARAVRELEELLA